MFQQLISTNSSHTSLHAKFQVPISAGFFMAIQVLLACPPKAYVMLYVHIYGNNTPYVCCQELGHLIDTFTLT